MTNDQAGLPGELFTTIDHVGIASRTPCSSFVSSCTEWTPKAWA